MAHWEAKTPAEVVERRWSVPLAEGDGISGVSTSATDVTVDSDDHELSEAVVVLSGGSAGTVGAVTVTVTTIAGHTHVETFYVPIYAPTAQAVTARDVCSFALRKIVGVGNDAEASELDDALDLLQGIFARFGIGPIPVAAGDAISVADDIVLPLKCYLRKLAHSTYEAPLNPTDAEMADWGERYLQNAVFQARDLAMPDTLVRTTETVSDLF